MFRFSGESHIFHHVNFMTEIVRETVDIEYKHIDLYFKDISPSLASGDVSATTVDAFRRIMLAYVARCPLHMLFDVFDCIHGVSYLDAGTSSAVSSRRR